MSNQKKKDIKALNEEFKGVFEDFDVKKPKDKIIELSTEEFSQKEMKIKKAQADLSPDLMNLEGITGIGLGGDHLGSPVLKIYVRKKSRSLIKKIKAITKEEPILIEETGDIVAQNVDHLNV